MKHINIYILLFLILLLALIGPHTAHGAVYNHTIYGSVTRAGLTPLAIDLINASEEDIITIDIDSNGGESVPSHQLINLILHTKALVQCSVTGTAASAAANIFTACHSYSIHDDAEILYHFGHGPDQVTLVPKNIEPWNAGAYFYYETMYYLFINLEVDQIIGAENFKKMNDGHDIEMTGAQWHKAVTKLDK